MMPTSTDETAQRGRRRWENPPGEILDRSLRALAHPITLVCVAALLVNDQVLKRLCPSMLTGKLSDFAGLFFFPYLLTAVFGLTALALDRPSRRTTGKRRRMIVGPFLLVGLAYVVTVALFVLVKVDPGFNASFNARLDRITGLPIAVAFDPTDLTALVVLGPSLTLLLRRRRTVASPPLHHSLVVLGLASLAVLATAPCPPPQPISRLVPTEGGVYALATAWEPVSNAFISKDAGRSWEYVDLEMLPADVLSAVGQAPQLPKIECVLGNEQTCYRVTGEEQFEASADGGRTWQVVWSVPASRRAFMAREASGYGKLLACGKQLDLRANDLAVVGKGADHTAIVAVGNEGVLLGSLPSGEWSRVGVGWAEPTPEVGTGDELLPPMIILGETAFAVLAGMASFILLSLVAWARLDRGEEGPAEARRSRWPWGVGFAVDLLVLAVLVLASLGELIRFLALPLIVLTVVLVWMYTGWSKAFRGGSGPSEARRALRISLCAPIPIALLAWTPFALWVVGVIAGYSAACIVAACGVLLAMGLAVSRLPHPNRAEAQVD
jgi:hypothetical protein